jgi:hypothetical protein
MKFAGSKAGGQHGIMRREGIAVAKEASIERTDSEDSQNFCEAAANG